MIRALRRTERGLLLFGRELAPEPYVDGRPDWQQASAACIRRALTLSQALPTGGWFALDASTAITRAPQLYEVDGVPLVLYRDDEGLVALPEACPHLGASLAQARVCDGKLVCPWHGLAIGREGHGNFRPLLTHDDGILSWVRIDRRRDHGDERGELVELHAGPPPRDTLTDRPILPERPRAALDAVVRVEADCEPRDVIQNRLDPWHGVHYHPHSFGALRVIDQSESAITVRVAYKVLGKLAVEVDARFHCSDARSIVMTIVAGEGEGSIVETHATPVRPGRTAIIEATLACSARRGFDFARKAAPALRPLMQWAARRLWLEDAAYAERLYRLRLASSTRATTPRWTSSGPSAIRKARA
jgi:isorenieratene synthase